MEREKNLNHWRKVYRYMSLIQVEFSSGIETEDTKRVATSIPIVCFSPDVLHWRPVKAVHLLSESLYFYSRPSRRWIKSCACMRKYEKKHVFGLEIWLRTEIKTLYEQVDSLNKASVKNIRTETNYQDGCRNTFCTSSFNPNRKYYLDHAHITIYFSPMIRILLPLKRVMLCNVSCLVLDQITEVSNI